MTTTDPGVTTGDTGSAKKLANLVCLSGQFGVPSSCLHGQLSGPHPRDKESTFFPRPKEPSTKTDEAEEKPEKGIKDQ